MAKKDNNNMNEDEKIAAALAAIEEVDAEVAEEARVKAEEEAKLMEERRQAAIEEMRTEETRQKILTEMPNQGRRYFLMVEDTEVSDKAVTVLGNIHGEIHVGDELFIMRPTGESIPTTVEKIEADEDGEVKQEAKNSRVILTLPIDFKTVGHDKEKVAPMFSVVTDVRPQTVVNNKTYIENPALLGLTLEYGKYSNYGDFMSTLISHIVRANFVLPVHSYDGEDGKKKLRLITATTTNKTTGESDRVMPVFTDYGALKMWKEVFDDTNKPALVVMGFEDLVKRTEGDQLDLVINFRGPIAVRLPRKVLESIINSKSYKANRAGIMGNRKITKEVIGAKEASKIVVGQPKETAEVKEIRKAFREYAAEVPEINAIGIMMKLQGGKRGYLVIVDCPESATGKIYNDLRRVAFPFMNSVKSMDFSLYSETVFADDYFSTRPLDYVKNPNV